MDTFEIANKLIRISNNGKTVTSKAGGYGNYGNAFGRIGMAASSKNKYKWKLTCMQRSAWMFIGIQSNRNVNADGNNIDYGYDGSDGSKCHLGKCEKYGIEWGAADVIEMRVDFERQEMGYSVNGIDQGIAFRNLQLAKTYYLVVGMCRGYNGESILLNDFKKTEEKENDFKQSEISNQYERIFNEALNNQQNQKQFDDENNALKQQINAMREESETEKQELTNHVKQIKNLEQQLNKLKSEINNLLDDKKEMELEMNELKEENER
eukprot:276588_1